MMYSVSIVITLLIYIFNLLKFPLLLLALITLFYIITKDMKNKKYRRNIFKNIKKTTELDYTLMMINEIKEEKKIIRNGNNIIVILERGIYFIKVLDYTNRIAGNINDIYFDNIIGDKKYKVKNYLIDYDKEYNNYQNKVKEHIFKYVVIRNDCILNIKEGTNIKVIKNKHLYYDLLKQKKIYKKEDLIILYDKLEM